MFRLADRDPVLDTPATIERWVNGPVSIAVLAYAFGQYRVQLWYAEPGVIYPEILAPEC